MKVICLEQVVPRLQHEVELHLCHHHCDIGEIFLDKMATFNSTMTKNVQFYSRIVGNCEILCRRARATPRCKKIIEQNNENNDINNILSAERTNSIN